MLFLISHTQLLTLALRINNRMSKLLRLRYRHTTSSLRFLILNHFHFIIFYNGLILTIAYLLTNNHLLHKSP